MNENNSEAIQLFFEILVDQFNIIVAVVSRRVVQRQIIAFVGVLLISWMVYKIVRSRWLQRHPFIINSLQIESLLQNNRWLGALYHLLTPVLALVLLYGAISWFAHQDFPNSLLQELTKLVWLWTFYRFLVAIFYTRFGEDLHPYRNWIMTPIFLLLVISQIVSILPGSIVLIDATIFLGDISLSARNLLVALIVLYGFSISAWVIEQIMDNTLPGLLNADPRVIESIAILTRYSLLGIGIIFSLGMLGLDFTSLAIVAGGLSVGIGIGLQEYVANFVSGLVILFEQTIRPGDVVEIENQISTVEKISLRATIVRTRANEEFIIPNSNFTAQKVKNLTKTERRIQLRIPFVVSSESDPELIRQITTDASLEHPLVLPDPPPGLLFLGFGDLGLDFELSVSIAYPELMTRVRSDLYYKLWDVFKEYHIEIPNPQRDVNLGDGWEKLTPNFQARSPSE